VVHFQQSHITLAVALINYAVAAALFIGAIVALYIVTNPKTRLALVGSFIFLFALSVGLLTDARRPEIFAATAAYAAVLVVFISGNLG
jgi:hypothetical protein